MLCGYTFGGGVPWSAASACGRPASYLCDMYGVFFQHAASPRYCSHLITVNLLLIIPTGANSQTIQLPTLGPLHVHLIYVLQDDYLSSILASRYQLVSGRPIMPAHSPMSSHDAFSVQPGCGA